MTENYIVRPEEEAEFFGRIIDIFEEFLEDKEIEIYNEEKEDYDSPAIIFGEDYDFLKEELGTMMSEWKIIEPKIEY